LKWSPFAGLFWAALHGLLYHSSPLTIQKTILFLLFLSFQTIDLTGNVGEDELDVGGAFVEGVGRQVAVEDAGVVVSATTMSSTFNEQKLKLFPFRHPIKSLPDNG
jgi:hypothetical protein